MDVPDLAAQAEATFFEERAAMREYLGNMRRDEAEFAAREDTQRWLVREAQAALGSEPGWRDRTRR